jgi:hypothetical protein
MVSNAIAANFEWGQAFTVLLWIKRESVGANMTLVGRFDSTVNANRGWPLQIGATNLPSLGLINDSNPALHAVITAPANASTLWQFIAGENTGVGTIAGLALLVNAAIQGKTSGGDTLAGNTILTGAPLVVGNNGIGPAMWYDGLIEFVRIVRSALSQPQIGTHYSDEVDAANNGAYLIGAAANIPITPAPPVPGINLYPMQSKTANSLGVGIGL